jgi:peptidoglycan/xylan/chitin deacetylase (PgdA/CDA1 family)
VQRLVESVATGLPGNLMMTSQQVRQVAASGMEVGGHTVNHPILRSLSEEEARAEIDGGRQALEKIVGSPVVSFAYPNGRYGEDYTTRDRDLVASLGFLRAVATRRGAAHVQSDIYQLPRFTPWDRTPQRWLARLLLAFGDAQ